MAVTTSVIELTIDGTAHAVPVDLAGESLLRVLRDHLGITSAKNACEQGECGSCTVSIDGEIACACLVPALQARGTDVRTVASLAGVDGELDPLQDAFLEHGAVQCGFCTPGFLVAARDLLDRAAGGPALSDDDIREGLVGNLCRCTGYQKILDAVKAAQEKA